MNKVKAILAAIAVFMVMCAAIVLLSVWLHRSNAERRRIEENYRSELRNDFSVQQSVTRKELKELFSKEVEQLKEYGIKTGNIENIVEVRYEYIDTLRYRDTIVYVYDTIYGERVGGFMIDAECYSLSGEIVGDTISVHDFGIRDDILISIYKEKKKCMFDRRRFKAIAISSCSKDTLSILRNLKVEKASF